MKTLILQVAWKLKIEFTALLGSVGTERIEIAKSTWFELHLPVTTFLHNEF